MPVGHQVKGERCLTRPSVKSKRTVKHCLAKQFSPPAQTHATFFVGLLKHISILLVKFRDSYVLTKSLSTLSRTFLLYFYSPGGENLLMALFAIILLVSLQSASLSFRPHLDPGFVQR